jgi:hypothetical protein
MNDTDQKMRITPILETRQRLSCGRNEKNRMAGMFFDRPPAPLMPGN